MSSKKDILSALQKPKIHEFEFDGIKMYIKSLSVGERLLSMQQAEESVNDVDYYIDLLMRSICDVVGNLIFTTAKDRLELLKIPMETLIKFFTSAVEVSVMEDKEGGTDSPASKKK